MNGLRRLISFAPRVQPVQYLRTVAVPASFDGVDSSPPPTQRQLHGHAAHSVVHQQPVMPALDSVSEGKPWLAVGYGRPGRKSAVDSISSPVSISNSAHGSQMLGLQSLSKNPAGHIFLGYSHPLPEQEVPKLQLMPPSSEASRADCHNYRRLLEQGRLHEAHQALRSLSHEGHASTMEYNEMLKAISRSEKHIGIVDTVVREMTEHQVPHDSYTVTSLVNVYKRAGRFQDAISVFELAEQHGVKHNVFTFSSLIDMYCRLGQVDEALQQLKRMRECKVAPNQTTIASLVTGFAKRGQFKEALSVIEQMHEEEGNVTTQVCGGKCCVQSY